MIKPSQGITLRAVLSSIPDFQTVSEAENGQDAVQKAIQLASDIVIMDVHMPVLDGIQATIRIKNSPLIFVLSHFQVK